VSGFDRLHPALQHHIVNSLGWSSLRPFQEQCIDPILDDRDVVLVAPTAGGKTEAASFPVLSRMLSERWTSLSVLYLCPLRALLNNLEPRLSMYARFAGRRVSLWHGDVSEGDRRRILKDAPDLLLTTPESLEVLLVSARVDHASMFANVRAVIVDEVHAFASDDRGWHLLAVLERVQRLAGRTLQRIGLSATVGNPQELLEWLAATGGRSRAVIALPVRGPREADVQVDYVGTLQNAAVVVSRLHRGEKRLVFCDSRARVEELASDLRALGVDTYVSHGSISAEERRRAEEAFASGADCVIVSTSTLELGIDVGDLSRVIQLEAPTSVASFLQRLGRTGRRAGAMANCLFLTTSEDTLIRALALSRLWKDGFIEPVVPPAAPAHLLGQQIMALSLQEHGIGRGDWPLWIEQMPGFASLSHEDTRAVLEHMLSTQLLFDDAGILSIGRQGEEAFGRRHFMDLLSSFTTEPLFMVKHGNKDLGRVHHSSFVVKEDRPPVLLLGGRSWVVRQVDWKAHAAFVEPTEVEGKSRWLGAGQPLRYALCLAMRRVLAGEEPGAELSTRAAEQLRRVRADFAWLTADSTHLVRHGDGKLVWWTFAGLLANSAIADGLRACRVGVVKADNVMIALDPGCPSERLDSALRDLAEDGGNSLSTPVSDKAIQELKFSECLPPELARRVLSLRMTDRAAITATLAKPLTRIALCESGLSDGAR
jgi:ATP-dependent Lhr-like helicase